MSKLFSSLGRSMSSAADLVAKTQPRSVGQLSECSWVGRQCTDSAERLSVRALFGRFLAGFIGVPPGNLSAERGISLHLLCMFFSAAFVHLSDDAVIPVLSRC